MADPNEESVLFDVRLPDLTLDHGAVVTPVVVRGWMWAADARAFLAERGLFEVSAPAGEVRAPNTEAEAPCTVPDESGRPTVLVIHALTGDAQAGGQAGWWSEVIGPGRPFDPNTHRILCFNNLGSCYGTSGPGQSGFPPGPVTTWDQGRVILRALDALGIDRVALATGGSLGGMITLSLAALAPQRFERIAPVAGCAAASAWIIGFNHVQRRAIEQARTPGEGLALARQIAMLTYRAEAGLNLRQGRRPAAEGAAASYRMQTYLDYQGRKLVDRFEMQTYLAMMDAMDHHDIGRPPRRRDDGENWTWPTGMVGLGRIEASCLAIGIDTDQLFLPVHSVTVADALRARGLVADSAIITSPHGHDAFLIEWDQLDGLLRRALSLPIRSTP